MCLGTCRIGLLHIHLGGHGLIVSITSCKLHNNSLYCTCLSDRFLLPWYPGQYQRHSSVFLGHYLNPRVSSKPDVFMGLRVNRPICLTGSAFAIWLEEIGSCLIGSKWTGSKSFLCAAQIQSWKDCLWKVERHIFGVMLSLVYLHTLTRKSSVLIQFMEHL